MCYLDIYSKTSFDIYEQPPLHIHAAELMLGSFCCIACVFREQIKISSLVFWAPLRALCSRSSGAARWPFFKGAGGHGQIEATGSVPL